MRASLPVRRRREVAGCRERPPDVTVDVRDERVFSRVLALGNLGLGEAYMDGDFALEQGRSRIC